MMGMIIEVLLISTAIGLMYAMYVTIGQDRE